MKKLQLSLNILSVIIFLLAAIYYLPIYNGSYLEKIQELSIFLPNQIFWQDNMKVPGGMIDYISSFLTQFFYYPWLGSVIFLVLLTVISFMIYKAFRLNGNGFVLSLLPSWLLLLMPLQLGYMIYLIHSPGFVYIPVLGMLVIAGFFFLYLSVENTGLKLMIGLLATLSYPLFGFYALFSAFLIGIHMLIVSVKGHQKVNLLFVLLIWAVIIMVPYFLYRYLYIQIELSKIYLIGLPYIFLSKFIFSFWIPFILLGIYIILFTVINAAEPKYKLRLLYKQILTYFAYAVFAVLFFSQVYRDSNFRTQIRMGKAVFNNDWDDVLKEAQESKEEPTRLIQMYTNLALQKKYMAGDNMFKFKQASNSYNAPVQINMAKIGGKTLYYQYALTNYCNRWCMEEMVEHGPRVDNLRYMVKCALINGEIKLAQKYNDLLKSTLFYNSWAKEYQKFIDNSELMNEFEEFNAIEKWEAYNSKLDVDNDLPEIFLLNYFGNLQEGPDDLLELSIQNALILRNINLFWPRFFYFYENNKRIPIHYQEAALLFSYLEKKVDASKLNLDSAIRDRFNSFINMTKQHFSSEESHKKAFYQSFGDTYWYYYFFPNDVTNN